MTTNSANAIAQPRAGRIRFWLTGAVASAFLLAGLAGRLSSGWGFALLLFAGLSLGSALAFFCVLVFSHRGDTARLVKSSKASFVVGAGRHVAAVCALAGYYVYETLQDRMELHWIIFGPLAVWALISFDSGIYGKLVKKNLPTWHRFKRFIIREDSDPVAMRRTAWNDIILQRSLFRTSKLRWFRHALIFWGFTAMFATELGAVVVRDSFPALGWRWSIPMWWCILDVLSDWQIILKRTTKRGWLVPPCLEETGNCSRRINDFPRFGALHAGVFRWIVSFPAF